MWSLLIDPLTWQAVLVTLIRTLIGLSIALLITLITVPLSVRYRWFYKCYYPFVVVFRSIPVVSVVLLSLLDAEGVWVPILIAFLITYPLLFQNLYQGAIELDTRFLRFAQRFRLRKTKALKWVYRPLLRPYWKAALQTTLGYGWRAVITAEVLAGMLDGIGGELRSIRTNDNIEKILSWTLLAILFSFLADLVIRYLFRLNIRPKFGRRKPDSLPKHITSGVNIHLDNIVCSFYNNNGIIIDKKEICSAEICVLEGDPQSGKTTLLQLLSKERLPQEGRVKIPNGWDTSLLDEEDIYLPYLTIKENISLVIDRYHHPDKVNTLTQEMIELLEIQHIENRYPSEVSQSEKERMMLARALIFPARLLLLDEPFCRWSQEMKYRIIPRIIQQCKEKKQTVLFTSHDPSDALAAEAERIKL